MKLFTTINNPLQTKTKVNNYNKAYDLFQIKNIIALLLDPTNKKG